MLHELVFWGCNSQFALYPHKFPPYTHSCKILQPYVGATLRMYSDAIFFSGDASRMKTFIRINVCQQIVVLCKHLSVRTHQTDTCESASNPTHHQTNKSQFADDDGQWTVSKNIDLAAEYLQRDLDKLAR